MIKLGKLTDYAIVVMTQLAREGAEASRSAHYLAEKTGVSLPTVAKVLKALTKENFVTSTRGTTGGYKLTRPAGQISLAEIITALDGPITIVSCVEGSTQECKTQDTCPAKGNWERVNHVIRDALESVKLTELAVTHCHAPYNFMKDAV